jgi:hypothetical protein
MDDPRRPFGPNPPHQSADLPLLQIQARPGFDLSQVFIDDLLDNP